jgi:hypothetical protein
MKELVQRMKKLSMEELIILKKKKHEMNMRKEKIF